MRSVSLAPARAMRRSIRSPQHTFQLRQTPFCIQPFFIAPVLPGETMKNLLLQARAVSDPIRQPLVGWWLEYYFFYVKHRDLSERDEFVQMMLDPTWTIANVDTAAADVLTYFAGNGINWTKKCLDEVVRWYFRDEEDAGTTFELDGLPIASLGQNTWLDSVMLESIMDANEPSITVGGDDVITASEIDQTMRQYQFLKANNMVQMSYEDYLKTYGIRAPLTEDPHKPELVRFIREWTYPTNTVEPTTGRPTSALSWSVAERADKDRFFSEPGFLFGVSVVRPKVYMANQIGSAVWFMNNAYTWLPAVLRDDPATSIQVVDGSVVSPLTIASANFAVDVRDILVHGDQFLNFTPDASITALEAAGVTSAAGAETTAPVLPDNSVPLPSSGLLRKYLTSIDHIKQLFVPTKTADTPTWDYRYYKVRQDGIVSLQIASSEKDHTPTTPNTTN